MAYQVKDVMNTVKESFPGEFKALKVDGGACANNFLMQFQSDILGLPVERPKIIETTALGAAGISGIASGFWTAEEFKCIMSVDRVFKPSMDPAKAVALCSRWQNAVERSKNWA